jgi:hypothetical protein
LEVGEEGGFKLDLKQDRDPGKQKLKDAVRTETHQCHYCQQGPVLVTITVPASREEEPRGIMAWYQIWWHYSSKAMCRGRFLRYVPQNVFAVEKFSRDYWNSEQRVLGKGGMY